MSSKGRPYRTVVVDGFDVLIGRSDADNEHLTLTIAEPHDVWLHAGSGTAGSHVVVRNPERGEVPHAVIARAAELAAWYSKARNAARVEVHYCRASDVKKRRGAPLGQVQLLKYKSVRVAPKSASDSAAQSNDD